MSKAAEAKNKNAYDGLGDMLASGFDSLLAGDEPEVMLGLDDIEIEEQIRPEDEFEDEENSLADLGKSLRKRQLQAILVRPNREGCGKPYLLVAGERRVRAARIEGLTQLRGKIANMSDEEAEEAQLAENIHRKNLSQRAEAKRVQRDLDELGSVEAVLEKHNKGRAWLSKLLSLLNLPEQTDRLVTENITADVEVINMAKQIEKQDPQAAKELVDTLKEGKGKINARQAAKQAKDQVKPPKKGKGAPQNPEAVATAKDRSHEEPGPAVSVPLPQVQGADEENAEVFAGAKPQDPEAGEEMPWDNHSADPKATGQLEQDEEEACELDAAKVPALPPVEALGKAYNLIFECGSDPKTVLSVMPEDEREGVENWLHSFYEAGVSCQNLAAAVIQGFRTGNFANEGHGVFALAAFLNGGEEGVTFNVLNIMGCVKA